LRLEPHLEALEAKANAIISISAVDIEAEERRQRQERAQVQLIQDSQKLFHLQYQVEAVTLLLNQQLAKRSDQNLSNIQADKEEEAGARLADFVNLSNIALTKFPTRFVLPYNYSRRLLQLRLTAPRTSKFKMFHLCMKTLSFV
jgi:sensor domain CHASE-containing protein